MKKHQNPTTAKGHEWGFTLIELVIVLAVLGALASIAVPQLTGLQDQAKITGRANTIASEIRGAFAEELADGTLETTNSGLNWTNDSCDAYSDGIVNNLTSGQYEIVASKPTGSDFVEITLPVYINGSVDSFSCYFGPK